MRSVKGKGVGIRQMSSTKTNVNEPLMKRHNGPNFHQNRGLVYASGQVQSLPDHRLGGGWREGGVSARQAYIRNLGTCRPDENAKVRAGSPCESEGGCKAQGRINP